MRIHLNGQEADIPENLADDRLLWVLRDHFGLNGPKYGCGAGLCGACMVHLDGAAERSCLLTPRQIVGRRVTTLESLGSDQPDGLHIVQKAWIDAHVPQCGYCQNGQVMTAAALLTAHPKAGPDEIAVAMDTVLCRCGTQPRIRQAIADAQRRMAEGA